MNIMLVVSCLYFGLVDLHEHHAYILGWQIYMNIMLVVSCLYFGLVDLHEHHASCVMLIFWAGRFT